MFFVVTLTVVVCPQDYTVVLSFVWTVFVVSKGVTFDVSVVTRRIERRIGVVLWGVGTTHAAVDRVPCEQRAPSPMPNGQEWR